MHKPNRWVVIGTAATVAGFAAGVATTGGARGIDLNDPIVLEEVAERTAPLTVDDRLAPVDLGESADSGASADSVDSGDSVASADSVDSAASADSPASADSSASADSD